MDNVRALNLLFICKRVISAKRGPLFFSHICVCEKNRLKFLQQEQLLRGLFSLSQVPHPALCPLPPQPFCLWQSQLPL